MSAPKSYPPGRGRHTGRLAHRLIFAAGLIGPILLLVLGCPINVPHPETEEQFAAQRAAGTKALTAFSFASPAATGTIDENAKTISVSMSAGTNVTALVATFTTTGASVKVGSVAQVSGATANDFSARVTYTVAAEDGSTASYVVTVTLAAPPSSAKAITAFWFTGSMWTIDESAKTIRVMVPYGTNVTALVARFSTTGASVNVGSVAQVSGTAANNFTSPVTYVVTAADGSTASYTVTVKVQAVGPSSTRITRFVLILYVEYVEEEGWVNEANNYYVYIPGIIDESAKTIAWEWPGWYLHGIVLSMQTAISTAGAVSLRADLTEYPLNANGEVTIPLCPPPAIWVWTVTAVDGTSVDYLAK